MVPWLCEPTTHNSDALLTQLAVGIAKAFNGGTTTYAVNAHYVKSTFAEKLSAGQEFN
jgi:hypothetical protein